MSDIPQTRPGDPVLASAASIDETRLFHGILHRIGPLPEGVRRVDFRFGEDSEGAPAVWVRFFANDDLKPSKAKLDGLRRVAAEVRAEIRRSGSDRWPCVEIETE